MFPNVVKTGLTFPKILSGISKTLNMANQIIPIYVQAKPMIQNARSAFQVAKEILSPSKETVIEKKKTPLSNSANEPKKAISSSTNSVNNPIFFV